MSLRCVRPLLGWAAVLVAVGAVVVQAAGSGQAQMVAATARGAQVYAFQCAACHGPDGQGGSGEDLAAGPALRGLEVAYVDQQMRTGRMPIVEPRLGVTGPERLSEEDREATLAWMTGEMGLTGEVPVVAGGEIARGQELYVINCAACHGSLGDGGIGAGGTIIRGVLGHDRVAQAEAIRVGPYDMPAFDEGQLSDQDVADIAEFVVAGLDDAPRTPLGLREMHRYTMWGMAGVLAVALLGMVVLLSRPVPYPEAGEDEG